MQRREYGKHPCMSVLASGLVDLAARSRWPCPLGIAVGQNMGSSLGERPSGNQSTDEHVYLNQAVL
jgi:hypothetical protein